MACRYCSSKPNETIALLQICQTKREQFGIPAVKIIWNDYQNDCVEIDEFVCPVCQPISASFSVIPPISSDNDFYEKDVRVSNLPMHAATVIIGGNLFIIGGCLRRQAISSEACFLLKFLRDGRLERY